MSVYRVGMVGLGRIASLFEQDPRARRYYPALTHAGSFSRHPRILITCACDQNPRRLRAFGRAWGVTALYRDYRQMLREQAIDILSVCTPAESHREIIHEAAGRVRMIFCEKPMGRNLAEASKLTTVCRRRGSRLAVNCYRLFDPAHRAVGRRLHRGELGRIQRVTCLYGKGLRNMGSHLISLLLSYFGPVASVRTLALHSFGDTPEATADFVAQFAAGFPCTVLGCDYRHYRIFEIDILGEQGRITLDREGFGFRFSCVAPNRAESGAWELRQRRSPVRPSVGRALSWAVENLVTALDRKTEPLSSGQQYLHTERVIEAVLESARGRGRLVAVN